VFKLFWLFSLFDEFLVLFGSLSDKYLLLLLLILTFKLCAGDVFEVASKTNSSSSCGSNIDRDLLHEIPQKCTQFVNTSYLHRKHTFTFSLRKLSKIHL
jgi:hypothetical protein